MQRPLSTLEVAAVLHDAVAQLESRGLPRSAAVTVVARENNVTANAVRAALQMISRDRAQRADRDDQAMA